MAKTAYKPTGLVPAVHYDCVRVINGKPYYRAEVTTNAGTHELLLDKKKVGKGEIRVRYSP